MQNGLYNEKKKKGKLLIFRDTCMSAGVGVGWEEDETVVAGRAAVVDAEGPVQRTKVSC